jgi:hypothetical protein
MLCAELVGDLRMSGAVVEYRKFAVFEIRVSRDSVVGITTSYGLDDRGVGVRIPVGSRIFTSSNRPDCL